MGCPFYKNKPCKQRDCDLYVMVQGKHPQTGQDISEYKCAFVWLPILMIENSKEVRETAAAVETTRNRMVEGLRHMGQGLQAAVQSRVRGPEPRFQRSERLAHESDDHTP